MVKLEVVPQHVSDDGIGRRRPDLAGADSPPVAQHGHTIDEPEELVEAMADIEDAGATAAQPPEDVEKMLRVGLRQGCGGLVQHHDAGLLRQGPHDPEHGLARGAQRADEGTRIGRLDAHRAVYALRLRPDPPPGDEAAATRKARHEGDVLADAQIVYQAEVLMDEGDRHRLGVGMCQFPFDADRAFIRLVDAGQDLDQRRLPGAVLADQRVDLAAADGQVDMVECQGAEEALGQAANRHRWRRFKSHFHPRSLLPAWAEAWRRRTLPPSSRPYWQALLVPFQMFI